MDVELLMNFKKGLLTIKMGLSLLETFDKMLSYERVLKEMKLCAKHQNSKLEDFKNVLGKEIEKIDNEWKNKEIEE